jgi:hypothetical protein
MRDAGFEPVYPVLNISSLQRVTHKDSHKLRSDALLIELIRHWPRLSADMHRALLAAASAYGGIMTQADLLKEVLQGVLLIVGEYRGSHAEEAGYIDKKYGTKISYIRGTHLAECMWHGHIDRVIITERFQEHIATVERAQATFTYIRGQRYAFYIDWLKRERGQIWPAPAVGESRGAEEALGASGCPRP